MEAFGFTELEKDVQSGTVGRELVCVYEGERMGELCVRRCVDEGERMGECV